jgi:uncharacterized protein
LNASEADVAVVTRQLGRKPQGRFSVVVRDAHGEPVVIKNAPLLDDGTPMPTLYWLTGPEQVRVIGQLESAGGVDEAEAAVDPDELRAAHDRYAKERDAMFGDSDGAGETGDGETGDGDSETGDGETGDTTVVRPTGGVAGTRTGVKCLHAHYAYLLAGGNDPVGNWVSAQLRKLAKHP